MGSTINSRPTISDISRIWNFFLVNDSRKSAEVFDLSERSKMQTTKSEKAISAAYIFIVSSIFWISILFIFGIFVVSKRFTVEVFTSRTNDFSNVALIAVAGIFIAGIAYVFFEWKRRATYIAIGANHQIVEPCSRRDEFIEFIPSYMQSDVSLVSKQ